MAGFVTFRQNIFLLKRANEKKFKFITCKFNKLTLKVLDVLWDKGFIAGYRFLKHANTKSPILIQVFLRFNNSYSSFQDLKIISRKQKNFFFSWRSLSFLQKNFSLVLINTPKGILSTEECLHLKVGGSLLLICI